ncbi:MAG: DUF4197 domain-containing protein [Mariprofundaceae bacterium]|nr:DUF4197 domain-containing protein [Mariprofundaceae bacterium]
MNTYIHAAFVSCALLSASGQASAGMFDQWGGSDALEKIGGVILQPAEKGEAKSPLSLLSNSDIRDGLKEALAVGLDRTVSTTSKEDGFWKAPEIQIPLPRKLQSATKALESVGLGHLGSDLHLRMNRAAEKAAPLAKPIFLKALKAMTIEDVKRLWKGPDDAATRYFSEKTSADLTTSFRPIVAEEMNRMGVVSSYNQLKTKYASIPFLGSAIQYDLESYVTTQALKGLFHILASEEQKIRKDPVARTTDLLKKVFQ